MTPLYAEFMTSLNEMYMGYTDKELSHIERAFNDAADRQIASDSGPRATPKHRHRPQC